MYLKVPIVGNGDPISRILTERPLCTHTPKSKDERHTQMRALVYSHGLTAKTLNAQLFRKKKNIRVRLYIALHACQSKHS